VTITTKDMTRFLLSLNQAVDTIFESIQHAQRGETYIPRAPSAKVMDIAAVLIDKRPIKTVISGIRPGEKVHEILISEEECHRTVDRGDYYAILPMLPELRPKEEIVAPLQEEFSSANNLISRTSLKALLKKQRLLIEDYQAEEEELLR
jgi:UDP-glucose 4-epimerase